MNPEKLSELLQNIDESLIARAGKRRKRNKTAIIRTFALCACLALVMTVTLHFALKRPDVLDKSDDSDDMGFIVNDDPTADGMTPDNDTSDGETTGTTTLPGGNEVTDESADSDILSDGDDMSEDRTENADNEKQNNSTQDNSGNNSSSTEHIIRTANDPHPFLTQNIQFRCGDYNVKQLYYPDFKIDKYRYYVTDANTGKYFHINHNSPLYLTEEVDFDSLPMIPYAANTVLKPIDSSILDQIGNRAYAYNVFRGVKSGKSTQNILIYASANGGGNSMMRYAYTPVTVTESLYGDMVKNDTIQFTENAAVVEYEGQKYILCADGYPPIKSETEYIFIVQKPDVTDTESDIYRPASPAHICVFEITDEIKAAKSADELTGLSNAEKAVYQKYYYDTL